MSASTIPTSLIPGACSRSTSPITARNTSCTAPNTKAFLAIPIAYRGNFGYQILDPERTVAAIVNIDETHKPSVTMIDDMLAQVRSQPGLDLSLLRPARQDLRHQSLQDRKRPAGQRRYRRQNAHRNLERHLHRNPATTSTIKSPTSRNKERQYGLKHLPQ